MYGIQSFNSQVHVAAEFRMVVAIAPLGRAFLLSVGSNGGACVGAGTLQLKWTQAF